MIFLNDESELNDSAASSIESVSQSQIQVAVLLSLIPVVVSFSFIIFVLYRSRREANFRQKETELKLSKAEVEIKALKAQINPHFIFNCLNSIHHFILKQETQTATDYLIKFSKLIRYVLESSEKTWVTLAEELESNELYLQLEQFRSHHSFDFSIIVSDELDSEIIFIPPMLLQPFLENSVWHGMSGKGQIRVEIGIKDEEYMVCKIWDNGEEKKEKSAVDLSHLVKKSSLGLHLMKERFRTLNELRGKESGFSFTEGLVQGKEVVLQIPYEIEYD